MRMKKRLLSILIAMTMILSLLPVVALADGSETTLPNAENGVIKLTSNVTATLTVNSNETITLDLNGYTLTNTDGQHTIINNGTLTITDTSTDDVGTVDNVTHAKAAVYNANSANCTILKGIFTRSKAAGTYTPYSNGGNSYYVLENQGTMVIGTKDEGSSSISVQANDGYSSLIHNGWQNSKDAVGKTATLTIYDGSFSGGVNTVKNDESGTLTINGGTFNNVTQYTVQNWNVATINGGTFESNTMAAIYNGAETAGTSDGQLTITGGEFTAADGYYVVYSETGDDYDSETYLDGASASISGGTYSSQDVSNDATYGEGLARVIQADGSCVVETPGNDALKVADGLTMLIWKHLKQTLMPRSAQRIIALWRLPSMPPATATRSLC